MQNGTWRFTPSRPELFICVVRLFRVPQKRSARAKLLLLTADFFMPSLVCFNVFFYFKSLNLSRNLHHIVAKSRICWVFAPFAAVHRLLRWK